VSDWDLGVLDGKVQRAHDSDGCAKATGQGCVR
jgi:hypothetical protein